MQYNEALDYIHSTLKFGVKLGLNNMNSLLELMGNPHKKLKYIHVAGTNGKGSTVSFISSILIEAGFKVGIYTSPYLERFTERMKINHEEISENELAGLTEFVKEKVEIMVGQGEAHPTEFEIVTAIAFLYFYQSQCDVVVLEVGLGGRFDSTNVIETPLISVITTISFDHMDKLGNTLEEIAFEKAGIIKENGEVILYPQEDAVENVFADVCIDRNAVLHKVDFDGIRLIEFSVEGQTFDYKNMKSLMISLLGEHQIKNAVVSICAMKLLRDKGWKISDKAIRDGLLKAKWPGRFEVLCRDPLFIIDGAHNAEGAKMLAHNLKLYFDDRPKYFIAGVLKDKDYSSMIEAIAPLAESFITVTPKSERALSAKDLALFVKDYCKNVQNSDTIEEAIGESLDLSALNGVICAFGSLYYIGQMREFFKDKQD